MIYGLLIEHEIILSRQILNYYCTLQWWIYCCTSPVFAFYVYPKQILVPWESSTILNFRCLHFCVCPPSKLPRCKVNQVPPFQKDSWKWCKRFVLLRHDCRGTQGCGQDFLNPGLSFPTGGYIIISQKLAFGNAWSQTWIFPGLGRGGYSPLWRHPWWCSGSACGLR